MQDKIQLFLFVLYQIKLAFKLYVASLIAVVYVMPLSDDGFDDKSLITCKPNSRFFEEYNLCLCSPNGTTSACSTYKCNDII